MDYFYAQEECAIARVAINIKSSKILSFDTVAEAYGLIYPRPSGKKFSFAYILPDDGRSISRNVAENHYDSRHDKLRKQYKRSTVKFTTSEIISKKSPRGVGVGVGGSG